MIPQPDYATIAALLVGGTPLGFKAYPDGSLVVIAPTGQKFQYTSDQVNKMHASLTKKDTTKTYAKHENQNNVSPFGDTPPSTASKGTPRRSRPKKS